MNFIAQFFQVLISGARSVLIRISYRLELLTGWRLSVLWQIMKYAISGVSGGVLQVVFLYLFVDRLGLWYLKGVAISYLITLVIIFSLQKFWTFQDSSMDTLHRQSFLYTLIACGAFVLNVVFMYILVDVFHMWHIAAQCFVVSMVGTLTFLMNRKFTFNTVVHKYK